MTTHELAKALLEGPNLPCTRRGYEGGVEVISHIGTPTPIHFNVHTEWYYGSHEYHKNEECYHEDELDGTHLAPTELAIHIR